MEKDDTPWKKKDGRFIYSTLTEAVTALSDLKGRGEVFAGGQSLPALMKQNMATPEHMVDIKGIGELNHITCSETEGLRGVLRRNAVEY